jgi:hypothetical protein
MARLIMSALLTTAVLSLGAPAFADPSNSGHALRAAAEAGHITPRGVWDGK